MLLLQEFDIEIRDKRGAENSVADHLSRIERESNPIDQVIRRCILDSKIKSVLHFCHLASRGGHYGSSRTARKVLDCGFYWPTFFRDAHQFVSTYKQCQRARMAISRRHEMPQQQILFCEVFDVWDLGFGVPKALISDQGSHFYNRAMSSLLDKYGVVHRIATTYHPQTNS
ncbi:putative mitochondrial protein, partial [Mucuna pruriens]